MQMTQCPGSFSPDLWKEPEVVLMQMIFSALYYVGLRLSSMGGPVFSFDNNYRSALEYHQHILSVISEHS